jgi:hypothetical protein
MSHGASAEVTNPAAVIDWSKGDSQAIDQSCGDINFTHMEDGHAYNLFVRGREATICSFGADGLKFIYPDDHGRNSQGKRTLYSFVRFGSEVLVAWAPGY